MDEATSNIDIKTEKQIETLMHKAFDKCTVITIAHRLQTVINSDKVLVLGDGKVLEYEEPQVLMQKQGSHFGSLIHHLKNSEVIDPQQQMEGVPEIPEFEID